MTALKVHICDWSSGLDELSPSERRDPSVVLAVLRLYPRFTVFTATEHKSLARTLDRLEKQGRIRFKPSEMSSFPWMEVEVLDAAR